MKNKLYFKIMFIGLVSFLLLAGQVHSEKKSVGSITFIIGQGNDVQVKGQDDTSWVEAKLAQEIYNDDIVKTASESRCEVTLSDKSVIRIGEQSEFVFSDISLESFKKSVKSELKKGKIWLNVKTLQNTKSEFQVKTPTAVCAVRGTIYRIDSDTTTTCLVYDGAVDVGPNSLWGSANVQPKTNSLAPVQVQGPHTVPPPYEVSLEDWVRIVKGFQITVRPDGKYAKSQIDVNADAALEWVKWNQQRDGIDK